jgi:MFS family permease
MRRKLHINLPLAAIVGEGLFSRLSFGVIGFTLPLYAYHMGLSLTQIGILTSLNSIAALALKPLIGWAADRFGLKRTFLVAISLRSLVSLLLGFAAVPWELYAIRTLHGLSMSMRDPSANALIAENGGEKSVGSAFAWYQTARTVASPVSKALAGILLTLTATNFSLTFFVAFALSALPLLVVLFFVKEPGTEKGPSAHPESSLIVMPKQNGAESSTPEVQKRPPLAPFIGFGFLVSSTAEMLSGLFPILATEYAGLSKAQAGMIYAVSVVVTVFSGPIFGWLSDHVSRKLVLTVRSFANTFSSLMYVAFPTFIGIGAAKTVDDMGKAAFRPAWGALMAQVSGFDKKTRARTMSLLSMGEDAGGVCAPILAGFLWSTWGIGVLMGARVVLAIVTEAYAFTVARTPEAGRLRLAQRVKLRFGPQPKDDGLLRSSKGGRVLQMKSG